MKKTLLTIIILHAITQSAVGQHVYSKKVQEQIEQTETNLFGRMILNGKADNIMDRMAHYKVNGLSIAVVQNYQIIWSKAYGWADQNEQRPLTTKTLFEPGSISKSLNAVGILKLVQDRKLSLDRDINEYLISWKFPYDSLSKGKKITLAHLLSHTGGTSVYGFPGYDRKSKIPTLLEIVDGKKPANTPAVRSSFEPGLKFQYSGGGTMITQLIISDVTRTQYDKFMYHNILKPMGLSHSFYTQPPTKGKLKHTATGYSREGIEVDHKFHIYPEQAAAGLWTTPTDLAKYLIETQLAYAGRSNKVLDQEMTKLHLTPYVDNASALGTFVQERNGVKYFFHDAGNEGFRGLYFGSVEGGNGLVAFVNSDDGDIIIELLNSVSSVYNWNGFDKPLLVNTLNIPDYIARKYPGVYLHDGKIEEVINKQDGLFLWADDQERKMYFTSDLNFWDVDFFFERSFIMDGTGNVIGYEQKANGLTYASAMKIDNIDLIEVNIDQTKAFGWHLLKTKRIDQAIIYLSKGITIDPLDLHLQIYLAHCYLFNNEPSRAIMLYKECLDRNVNDSSLKDLIKHDLDFFRSNGFDNDLIETAVKELQI